MMSLYAFKRIMSEMQCKMLTLNRSHIYTQQVYVHRIYHN